MCKSFKITWLELVPPWRGVLEQYLAFAAVLIYVDVLEHARATHPFGQFTVRLDPVGDGQCQFASICDQLSTIGIVVSVEQLRSDVVSFLANNPLTAEGSHMKNYVPVVHWDEYLAGMADSGTYGDHLTLYAAARLHGVQFVVMSSLGLDGTRIISAEYAEELRPDQPVLFLGHYAETGGQPVREHYVSLSWECTSNDWTEFIQSLHGKPTHQPTEKHEIQSHAEGSLTVRELLRLKTSWLRHCSMLTTPVYDVMLS